MTTTNRSQDTGQNGQVRELEEEVDRYRRASEDALQQLDWCIGYLLACGKTGLARGLGTNRSHIRQHLLQRAKQPVPTETSPRSDR